MMANPKPTSLAKSEGTGLADDLHFVADEIVALAGRAKDPAAGLLYGGYALGFLTMALFAAVPRE